jgi:phosphoglycerol transferase
MRGREADWQAQWLEEPRNIAVAGIAAVGFRGIYVDRFGYADRAAALESDLKRVSGGRLESSANGRLSFIDLAPCASRLRSTYSPAALGSIGHAILHPPRASWASGLYGEESDGVATWRWMQQEARIEVDPPLAFPGPTELTFRAESPAPATLHVDAGGETEAILVPPGGADVRFPLPAATGRTEVVLRTDAPRVASADTRDLHLRLIDPRVRGTAVAALQGCDVS